MEARAYDFAQRHQPLVIGNNALDLNYNDFYCIVRDSYNSMTSNENIDLINTLPEQANIRMIQQVFLDLARSDKPVIIGGVAINFADDIWDFTSQYKAGKAIPSYKYDFNTTVPVSDYQNILLKLFTFYCITEYGIHNGTNKSRISEVKQLMVYMQKNDKELVDNLTLDDYKSFYSDRDIKYTTMVKCRRHIKEFLTFYSIIANDVYTKELSNWFNDIDTPAIKADIENNKTPLLPTSFYNAYTAKLFEVATNTVADKWERGYCGLLYIGTQTGLRASELTLLRVQDLEVRKFKGNQIGILHYRSTKSGDGKGRIYDNAETNANQKVISVYEILSELFDVERTDLNVDFLVPRDINTQSNGTDKSKRSQMVSQTLGTANKRICAKHAAEWGLINTKDADSFGGRIIYNQNDRYVVSHSTFREAGFKDGDVFSYPLIMQYRVYVASELRERGVDDRTTAFLFNHHCVEMYGYYARPKHSIQEDIDFSKEIVRDVVKDKTKILGPKGEAFTEKINSIIEANNFNVEADLESIIEAVCNEVPIRAKNGGFCIKSNPRRECRHDAKTDEFMCAYGCCPNHCHMYFMLPMTYEKAKTLLKTYNYNIKAGYDNSAEKEKFKLEYTINHELLPELIEAKNELNKQGATSIVQKHPEMATVIDLLEEIEMEIALWSKQIEKPQLLKP